MMEFQSYVLSQSLVIFENVFIHQILIEFLLCARNCRALRYSGKDTGPPIKIYSVVEETDQYTDSYSTE